MAPLTRSRAPAPGGPSGGAGVPGELNAEYYAQRASAGLIISEASPISHQGVGYPDTAGIYSAAHVAGWREVTRAVHAAGGVIFCQLWHVGRMSHQIFQPGGGLPVSSSALSPGGVARTPMGMLERPTPRALELEEISGVVADYAHATRCAREAGFDGVEIHAANGYLIDQFLRDSSNQRQDAYGGVIENRARFLFEVVEAVLGAWPAGQGGTKGGGAVSRVGIRLSPSGNYSGMFDSTPRETFGHVVRRLNEYPLAYAHIMRSLSEDPEELKREIPISFFRELYRGVLVTNGRFSPEEAEVCVREGVADAVAFGKLFISNPDLAERIGKGGPYAAWDAGTFYTPGAKGYTDYPRAGVSGA
jgi:N-ethylmaleimide reductase